MGEERQIHFMQVRLVRLAAEKWGRTIPAAARLMAENDVFRYIADCFGIFHVEGDRAVLEDIEEYLKGRGVAYDHAVNG